MHITCVLVVSIWSLFFMIFRIDFGNVPTMWYYCFCFISTVQHNVHVLTCICHIFVLNSIGVVMVSFLDSSAIDHGLRAPVG
jgi:hypothetical protein